MSEKNQPKDPAMKALDAFLGHSVKSKAPARLTRLFPFLDQPGLLCPSLLSSVADGILWELEENRKEPK